MKNLDNKFNVFTVLLCIFMLILLAFSCTGCARNNTLDVDSLFDSDWYSRKDNQHIHVYYNVVVDKPFYLIMPNREPDYKLELFDKTGDIEITEIEPYKFKVVCKENKKCHITFFYANEQRQPIGAFTVNIDCSNN